MRVALVGSSGYIARFLIDRFERESVIEEVCKIDQDNSSDMYINLQNPEKFDYSILARIDYVIFTAAVSSPDRCADEFEQCWSINVSGTCYFIKMAISYNCRVLFFSSDAVFGDIKGKIYNELSETNAKTSYGRMKKAVEDKFKDNKNFKVIRLSYVVSAKDRFVSYCLKCIENNETADVFHPFYRNCIVVSDVVDVVVWFINHWDEYKPFVLNVAGRELVSRVRIADEINRFLGENLKYRISVPDDSFYMNRPKITQMDSIYMQKYCILENNSFTEKIKKEWELLRNYGGTK